MSIELSESKILAEQMNNELRGKRIKSYRLQDYERLQRIGMLNKDIKDFYDFTVDDFKLEGYKKGEQIKGIPVAV